MTSILDFDDQIRCKLHDHYVNGAYRTKVLSGSYTPLNINRYSELLEALHEVIDETDGIKIIHI